MENGKYLLSPKQARSCYVLRRRRRELTRRINSKVGSKESIRFDLEEHQAISTLLDLIREIAVDGDPIRKDEESEYPNNNNCEAAERD